LHLNIHPDSKMRLANLLSVLLLLLAPAIHAAVLAIDYGAEFTKLSLVKPGVPFDVVLDRDSKRKIQSVVGWKRDERVFGQEGKMAVSRRARPSALGVGHS
jgi:hypoxia up-regulated 1